MIPLSVPNFSGNEWKYVKECLDTGWVSSAGKYVDLFEQKIAEYTKARYAIACINGTAALQVSLRLVGVQPGDEVIFPAITFIASVNAATYNGASPVFMDVDEHLNIDFEETIDFIKRETEFRNDHTYNKKTGRRITAMMAVHMYGCACWLDELAPLCEERNICVVEDAAESLGTSYISGTFSGKHTGTIGKLGCLSFNGNKIITTGGGGMIITDDEDMAEKAKYLTTQAKDDPVRYVHNEIGYNFRLTNVQSALGVAQLEQLQMILERKKEIHQHYTSAIMAIDGLSIAPVPEYAENNYWLNILRIEPDVYGRNQEALMADFQKNGIQTRPVWYPNHLQKPYRDCQVYGKDRAETLVETSLCLPSSSQMTDEDIVRIMDCLYG